MNGKERISRIAGWLLPAVVACCTPLAACQAQTPQGSFDQAKAAALTREQRERMDVAFFNDFVVRDMPAEMWRSGANHPRGARIRKLAEEGFELAWLAEKFYDFDRMGFRDTPDAERYWRRIRELADGGDASAQCFVWRSAPELRSNGFFKPSLDDVSSGPRYLELAAAQGQAQCSGDWGNYRYENEPAKRAELNLYGARKGCAECMARVRVFYLNGLGLPQELAKAWCWALEAEHTNDSGMYASERQSIRWVIAKSKPNETGRPEDLTQYRAGSHCSEPISTTASSTESIIEPTTGSK